MIQAATVYSTSKSDLLGIVSGGLRSLEATCGRIIGPVLAGAQQGMREWIPMVVPIKFL